MRKNHQQLLIFSIITFFVLLIYLFRPNLWQSRIEKYLNNQLSITGWSLNNSTFSGHLLTGISSKDMILNNVDGTSVLFPSINARIKILKAEVLNVCDDSDDTNSPIGFVSESLVVKCGDKFLKINELQKEGKKKMSANEYINGNDMKNCFFK